MSCIFPSACMHAKGLNERIGQRSFATCVENLRTLEKAKLFHFWKDSRKTHYASGTSRRMRPNDPLASFIFFFCQVGIKSVLLPSNEYDRSLSSLGHAFQSDLDKRLERFDKGEKPSNFFQIMPSIAIFLWRDDYGDANPTSALRVEIIWNQSMSERQKSE